MKASSTFHMAWGVDSHGHVFVVDSGNMRVQEFMPAEEAEDHFQEEEALAFIPEAAE